jgi:hypothetical protein
MEMMECDDCGAVTPEDDWSIPDWDVDQGAIDEGFDPSDFRSCPECGCSRRVG